MSNHSLFSSIMLIGFLLQGLAGTCQVMHPQSQIDFMKTQLKNHQEPYWEAYQELLAYADISTEHHALKDFNVRGFYVDPEAHRNNSKSLQTDAWTFPTLMKPMMNY